jgi:uncharacterized LabA/DUF88 family protein
MEHSLALLIDAENVSAKYINLITDEANKKGKLNYRRVYGDWTQPQIGKWKKACTDYALTPVQQFSPVSGKSSSDFSLVIDAMDILNSGKVDGFVIVSSDSDFTKLITRLNEDNMTLLGMGEEKTPSSLVSSYNDFIYLDKLFSLQEEENEEEKIEEEKKTPKKSNGRKKDTTSITPLTEIYKTLHSIVEQVSDDDGWAYWGVVAELIKKKYPGFHPRNYGKRQKELTFFTIAKKLEKKVINTSLYVKNK